MQRTQRRLATEALPQPDESALAASATASVQGKTGADEIGRLLVHAIGLRGRANASKLPLL